MIKFSQLYEASKADDYAAKAAEYKSKAMDYSRRHDNVNEAGSYFYHYYYSAMAAKANKDLDNFDKFSSKASNVFKRTPQLKKSADITKKLKSLDRAY